MPVIQELDTQALCSICMEPKRQSRENSTDLEPIWQLATPCNHSFHQACLKTLLESGAAHLCPLCRAAISHDDLMGICGFGGSVVDFSDGYVSNHTIDPVNLNGSELIAPSNADQVNGSQWGMPTLRITTLIGWTDPGGVDRVRVVEGREEQDRPRARDGVGTGVSATANVPQTPISNTTTPDPDPSRFYPYPIIVLPYIPFFQPESPPHNSYPYIMRFDADNQAGWYGNSNEAGIESELEASRPRSAEDEEEQIRNAMFESSRT